MVLTFIIECNKNHSEKILFLFSIKKNISLFCTVGYKWVTVIIDGIKFTGDCKLRPVYIYI